MLEDLKKAKDKVEALLKEFPELRDSDKKLWLAYLVKFHNLKNLLGKESYMIFRSVVLDENTCVMESIRRIRQKFQEEGKYLGTKRKKKIEEAASVKKAIVQNELGF